MDRTEAYLIDEYGIGRAEAFRLGIGRAIDQLQAFPGSAATDEQRDHRKLVVGPYVITYRLKDGAVLILRVLHARQDRSRLR